MNLRENEPAESEPGRCVDCGRRSTGPLCHRCGAAYEAAAHRALNLLGLPDEPEPEPEAA